MKNKFSLDHKTPSPYLTKAEAMAYLKISYSAMANILRLRKITSSRIGRDVRFKQADIDDYFEKRSIKAR